MIEDAMAKSGSGMNRREQVLRSLRHQEPEKVIVDFGSTTSSGISAIAYNRLKKHVGIEAGPARVYDVIQQLAIVEEPLLDLFGADLVSVDLEYPTGPEDWYPVTLADGSTGYWMDYFRPTRAADGSYELRDRDGRLLRKMPAGTPFFSQMYWPWADGWPEDLFQLPRMIAEDRWGVCPRVPFCFGRRPDFWQTLRKRGLELRERSDRAIVFNVECNLLEWGVFLRRMDNYLMDLYADPGRVEELTDVLLGWRMEALEKIVEAVGDIVDVYRFADDLGMDQGPYMPAAVYRKIFKPRHKHLCDYVKKHTRGFTCLHSCGSIYELIPDLIEAGFDCLNPVQTNCVNMEPRRLKQEFGSEVVFWGGGCDSRSTLNFGTPEEVRRDVRERLEIFAKGGGFVFCPIHNILPDVPPENIEAMFETVKAFNGVD
jgi:uroporphyrinogen decarboxylase